MVRIEVGTFYCNFGSRLFFDLPGGQFLMDWGVNLETIGQDFDMVLRPGACLGNGRVSRLAALLPFFRGYIWL